MNIHGHLNRYDKPFTCSFTLRVQNFPNREKERLKQLYLKQDSDCNTRQQENI